MHQVAFLHGTVYQYAVRIPVTQPERVFAKIESFPGAPDLEKGRECPKQDAHELKNPSNTHAVHPPISSTGITVTPDGAGLEKANPVSFVREHGWKFVIISALLLLPCFWHSWLVAGDFGSHLYNAWLEQLIERRQAPGLWIAPQWNNVLFDCLLRGLGRVMSLEVAGRIAVSGASLLFFWGAFSFVAVVTRRLPWVISPLLAAISYGWTFQEGLLNYYLSLGLAFWGLAFFWKRKGWQRLVLLLFSPMILFAHPIGFAWFIGGALYISAVEIVPWRFHVLLVLICVGTLFVAHRFLWHHYRVEAPAHSAMFYNGLDQLIFTNRYLIPVGVLVLFAAFALGRGLWNRGHDSNASRAYLIPLQLYVIVEAGVLLLPDAVYWPQFAAPTSLLTERFTLISAVLICCLLGAIQPHKWHAAALSIISLTYFSFLYLDTATLNQMEEKAWRLVHTAAPGDRILATIVSPLKYRFSTKHIVDQACLGYCFSYGNYEAPSTQFRIRATPGNRYVMSDIRAAAAMEAGEYVVERQDLPAWQIYQCGPTWRDLCIHELRAGERNDRLGIHPELGIYPRAQGK